MKNKNAGKISNPAHEARIKGEHPQKASGKVSHLTKDDRKKGGKNSHISR